MFGDFGLELGHINPAFETVPTRVLELASEAVRKFKLVEGPLKLDLIYTKAYGWCILEAAARWSGGYDHGFSAKYATRRNLEKPLLDFALGLPFTEADITYDKHIYCAVYTPKLSGTRKIDSRYIASIRAKPNVVKVIWTGKQPGAGWQSCADRELFIMATGNSVESAWNAAVKSL